jgi:hypothetical protein
MTDGMELIIRFHAVSGDHIALTSSDFAETAEALQAIANALNERRGLVLNQVKYDSEASVEGAVIHLANVVTVQVSTEHGDTTRQYL